MMENLDTHALIPHAEKMCLLDNVQAANADSIVVHTGSHKDPENPLLIEGHLPCISGVEYAAQAVALHAALPGYSNREGPQQGYLASLRKVSCHVEYLELLGDTLEIEALKLAADSRMLLYHFTLRDGQAVVCEGKLSIALQV